VVTDFGIGIPKSELANIFTPFIRKKNVDLIQERAQANRL
jgi:signal transduction histidine kinase